MTLFNKCDQVCLLSEPPVLRDFHADECCEISALSGENVEEFLHVLEQFIKEQRIDIELVIPYPKTGLLQLLRAGGQLISEDYREDGIALKASVANEVYQKVLAELKKN